MKRFIRTFLFASCIAGSIHNSAQAQDINKLRLGLTASPSVNWFSPDNRNWEGDGANLGISFGLVADIVLVGNDNYLLHTGFNFTNTGGEVKFPTARLNDADQWIATDAQADYRLQYIDIPLAIKLRTNEIGYVHYYGLFGATTGFNIRAKRDIEYSALDVSIEDEDISSDVSLFRVGLLVGAGAEFKISGSTNLQVGVSYQNGFTSVLKGDTYETNDNGVVVVNDLDVEPEEDRAIKTLQNIFSLNLSVLF